MLFSSIKYASHNDISGERFQRALAWLAATDMSGIEVEPVCDFNEEDDFGLYANPAREAWVTLHEGDIVVTPPEDAHKPGCCEDAPAPLKKICVKVLVD